MSHYYTRYCAEHGEYDADVDGDQECEQCVKEGKTPMQKAEARIAELEAALTAARAEAEALRKDAERLKFQYSQYVKTCEAVGLGGVVSYEQWISAIDAARSERGIV